MGSILQDMNAGLAATVQEVRRSLVQLENGGHSIGSGTIWHSDGLIVTNAHVADYRSLQATLPDGRTLPTRVLARDASLDLAALEVDATGLLAIALGDSTELRPGEVLLALGHPWGVPGAVTAGVFIGLERGGPVAPNWGREWLVADLHLRPGHSGGPVVDVKGRIVGINTIMASPDVGVAVPVHVVKSFLQETVRPRLAKAVA